jgi:hypothetical protein
VLLRELSRDVLELLRTFVGSTSFPSIPASQLASLSAANPNAFGSTKRVRNATARIAAAVQSQTSPHDSPTLSARASDRNGKGSDLKGGPPLNSVAWEQTAACALMPVRSFSRKPVACHNAATKKP